MTRSLKKGPYVDDRVIKKLKGLKPSDKKVIKTWSRACSIAPEMVGFIFGVYNGKDFINVFITEEMVGHKLGEFSPTTKFGRHGGKMQRDLEKGAVEKESAKTVEPVKPKAKK